MTSPPNNVWPMAISNDRQGNARLHAFASLPVDATNVRCAAARAFAAKPPARTAISASFVRRIRLDMGDLLRLVVLLFRHGCREGSVGAVAGDPVVAERNGGPRDRGDAGRVPHHRRVGKVGGAAGQHLESGA